MEQSLGKRISEYRKQRKMTQDQLADQLGITAQAVSKWENDQSCPDITVLPKLAAIFGISTDTLLGTEHIPVREAQIVEENLQHGETDAPQKSHWELHFDSGRKSAIGFALWVLLIGGLLLTCRILGWDIGLWSIAWPSALLMAGLFIGKRFSFLRFGLVLFGGYFLLENLNLTAFRFGSELIWPAIIVLFGLALLADALRKPKKPKFTVSCNDGNKQTHCNCRTESDSFNCNLSFGENTHYVSTPCLSRGSASVNFGELTIDLSGCERVGDDCMIDFKCSFGELNLLVPKRYRIEPDSATVLASFEIDGEPDPNPSGIIYIKAAVSFGEINISYIDDEDE